MSAPTKQGGQAGRSDGGTTESDEKQPGWHGKALPRGHSDVTDQVDTRGLELLNAASTAGPAKALFDPSQPSGLRNGRSSKGKERVNVGGDADRSEEVADWVESDTDEELMLYMPLKSLLKIHSLQVTSLAASAGARAGHGTDNRAGTEEDNTFVRPRTLRLYTNRAHNLGFEEASDNGDVPATQSITLRPQDWNGNTHTITVDLRYVKFQNVSSLVLFVVNGEEVDDQDVDVEDKRVRIDRIRLIGESGEKREMGPLEKVSED